MFKRKILIFFCIIFMFLSLGYSAKDNKKNKGADSKKKNEVIAKVGDELIRMSDLEDYIKYESSEEMQKYYKESDYGKLELLKDIIQRKQKYYAAIKKNLVDQQVIDSHKFASENYLIYFYQLTQTSDKIKVTPEEIKKYYEDNKETQFKKAEWRQVYAICTNTEDSMKLAMSYLEKGADFKDLARDFAANQYIKMKRGILGKVDFGQPLPLFGVNEEISNDIFSLKVGEYTKKYYLFQDKYYLLYVNEIHDAEIMDFDSVSENIKRQLEDEKLRVRTEEYIDSLKNVYGYVKYIDKDGNLLQSNLDSLCYGEIKKLGYKFTKSKYESILSFLPMQIRINVERGRGKEQLVERELQKAMLLAEAKKVKYENNPKVIFKTKSLAEGIYGSAYGMDYFKYIPSDEMIDSLFKKETPADVIAKMTPEEIREKKGYIMKNLIDKYRNERWNTFQADLDSLVKYEIYEDKLVANYSLKDLFLKAEESKEKKRYMDAIFYYEKAEKSKESKNEDKIKAKFMKAFVYHENLREYDKAIKIYDEIIALNNELSEAAKYQKEEAEKLKKGETISLPIPMEDENRNNNTNPENNN